MGFLAGGGMTLFAIAWYVWVQAIWFRDHLGLSGGRAAGVALGAFVKPSVVNGLVTAIFFG